MRISKAGREERGVVGGFDSSRENSLEYSRSILETNLEILRAIKVGYSHPAAIMQRAKLSWTATVRSLHALMKCGAISHSIPRNYVLTEKGERILSNYLAITEGLKGLLD